MRAGSEWTVGDERRTQEFLRSEVGYTWDEFVSSPSTMPPERLANSVIKAIPHTCLQEALQNASGMRRVPQLTLAKFGSSMNGFGSSDSDVDLVILPQWEDERSWFTRNYPTASEQKYLTSQFLGELRRSLQNSAVECSWFEFRRTARIPLLRMEGFHVPSEAGLTVSVDITFMNEPCVLDAQLLRNYALVDERLCRLGQLVKLWAKRNELVSSQDNQHMFPGSFAWVVMCIFFFQSVLHGCPNLCGDTAPIKPVWGCKNSLFIDSYPRDPKQAKAQCNKGGLTTESPVGLFVLFLKFIVHKAENVAVDLHQYPLADNVHALTVVDPVEFTRVVNKNTDTETWNAVKTTCLSHIRAIERMRSVEQFFDLIAGKLVL